jgi:deoxyribonuclease-1
MTLLNAFRRSLGFFSFFLISLLGWSQIVPSSSTLDFTNTSKEEGKTKSLSIRNNFSVPVSVYFKTSHPDFTVSAEYVTLEAGKSKSIEVTFSPKHNVRYNAELVMVSSHPTGDLSVDLIGQGIYKNSYYAATRNKSQEALKTALKTIISTGYTSLGYTAARDNMYSSIDNHNGTVTCAYTGRQANFSTRSGANSAGFNCEHTWPQSFFNQNEPERSDIHHLFPTDASANSRRGNYAFDYVSSPTWQEGGSKLGGGRFEPRDEQKGRTARAMFYFALRYNNYSNFLTNQENVLREWHELFAPETAEKDRNDAIFLLQKNRNPFVDYPEFLDRISSISTTAVEPVNKSIMPSRNQIRFVVDETLTSFVLVVTNTGNQLVRLNAVKIASSDFKVTVETSSLAPGESTNVLLEPIEQWPSDKKVVTTLDLFSSSDPEINLSIPVTAVNGILDAGSFETRGKSMLFMSNALNITNAKGGHVVVYNTLGMLVYFNDIKSDFTDISLSHLPSGVYFAVLNHQKSLIRTKRFVLKH